MFSVFLALWMLFSPFAQDDSKLLQFDVRARQNLLLGKGDQTGRDYYDVVITKQPSSGVLVKLPYTQKGGKFSFDLHHRVSLTPDFADAEVTTIVEIISGGGTSMGVFNIIDKIPPGGKFD